MSTHRNQLVLGFAIIVVAAVAVAGLSDRVLTIKPKLPETYGDSDLALQGKRLKGYALGSEGLIADWYWILSLQYIGGKIVKAEDSELNIEDLGKLNPRLLYHYLDNATDLDPKFFAAYSYGAIVLPAIDAEQAIALSEKGIRDNPDQWRLYQYLGYIYWRLDRFEKAAEVYEAGSRIHGAPPFLKQMAASMLTKGGSRDVARAMYTQMFNEAGDQQSRQNARLRLAQLDSLDELDAINLALGTHSSDRGGCPPSLSEIMPALQKVRLPADNEFEVDSTYNLVDPSGIPYLLDRSACRAHLDYGRSKVPAH